LAERAYQAIRTDLKSGIYLPGDRIEAAVAAMRLHTSVSPVRAALHRLAGERLVEAHAHEGFSVPRLTEVGLRDQFEWNHHLVLLALRFAAHRQPRSREARDIAYAEDIVAAIERLISQIGRESLNHELRAALETSNIRLHRARRIEADLTPALADKVRAWEGAWAVSDHAALIDHFEERHERRRALVPLIIESLYRAAIREP